MNYPHLEQHPYKVNAVVWWRQSRLDGWLLFGLISLMIVGLIVLYSASGQSETILKKQIFHMLFSLGIMVLIAHISPLKLKKFAPWIYFFSLSLLVLVLFIGDTSKGAQRWLDFGIRFQPSEIMKIALPITLASFLDTKLLPIKPLTLILCLLIILAPTIMIMRQPDLGTSVLIFAAGAVVIFFAGISFKIIFGLVTLAIGSLPIFWTYMLEYQKKRVLTFLHPENDPLGSGYHIIQSKIALGSGGFWGKGWLQGTQTQLDFLPEQSTDFIFSVLGEEFGLFGILLLFSIYFFIICRGLYIGSKANDTFSRLLAGSLISIFFIYILVNAGMVSGLLPVVGIPLPLISYGGTSMVTLMVLFGIMMSIHSHRSTQNPNGFFL